MGMIRLDYEKNNKLNLFQLYVFYFSLFLNRI